ncbi:hypothetical protein Y032_0212g2232 [Ancylostoma ceylanicum]|uniref:Receptor L-domain domain-containing protein n=1 Tax=Ancylostoma ceylanicum TaxID=53326 RepID=A0A016SJU4_9BILA|nr:hypothetical protein Y032_0212g2232 [Ancylostoma ceylanicum]
MNAIGAEKKCKEMSTCVAEYTSLKEEPGFRKYAHAARSHLPSNIKKLEQVEKINGRLFVTDNQAVPDLFFLRNLKEINNPELDKAGLVIRNNKNFQNIGLESLEKVTGEEKTKTPAKVTTTEARKHSKTSTTSSSKSSTMSTAKGSKTQRSTWRTSSKTTYSLKNLNISSNDKPLTSMPPKAGVHDKGLSGPKVKKGVPSTKKTSPVLICLVILIPLLLIVIAIIVAVVIIRRKKIASKRPGGGKNKNGKKSGPAEKGKEAAKKEKEPAKKEQEPAKKEKEPDKKEQEPDKKEKGESKIKSK